MASPIEQGNAPDPQVTRRRRSRKPIVPELPTPQNATLIAQLGERFERRLAREGMPPELSPNIVFTPSLDAEYQSAAEDLRKQLNEEPTHEQIAARLTTYKRRFVQDFGRQVPLTDNLNQLPELRESIEEMVLRGIFHEEMTENLSDLKDLSAREQAIVFMRFGINTEEKTPETIGEIYAVTGEIIRREERAALSKMRGDIRFASQVGDVTGWQNRDRFFEKSPPSTEVGDLRILEVPVFDPRDDRPYLDRLKESANHSAHYWLEAKKGEFEPFIKKPRRKLNAWSREHSAKKLRRKIREEQQEITRQLEPLIVARRRVMARPLHPESRDAKEATLFLLNTKIQTLTSYSQLLQSHAPL